MIFASMLDNSFAIKIRNTMKNSTFDEVDTMLTKLNKNKGEPKHF